MSNRVQIVPIPEWYASRGITRFLPMPPPIFPDGDPTADDVRLALELIESLDDQSRAWYGSREDSLRRRLAEMQDA
mgnify:FL=1